MPPSSRVSRRRRSSLAIGVPYVKPGKYCAAETSPRNVQFAPNVTPVTFNDQDELLDEELLPQSSLFPPSQSPAFEQSRRRQPPGKRRSQGYIPRPPNAFMLFRANFVRQKHVPGSIETTHTSLSKIIGNIWKELPLEQRRVWELEAKKAKADHKIMYPDYKFKPVHNKDKKRAREEKKKQVPTPVSEDEERRADAVTQLLLAGKKGDDLATAIRQFDRDCAISRTASATPDMSFAATQPYASSSSELPIFNPVPLYAGHRRSSSVPLPAYNPISLPLAPFLGAYAGSRAPSPVGYISGMSRSHLGYRRASSVQPIPSQPWGFDAFSHPQPAPLPYPIQRDPSPLPDADTSLFQSEYITEGSSVLSGAAPHKDFSHFGQGHHSLSLSISPLDGISSLSADFSMSSSTPYSASTADLYSATTYSTAPSPEPAYCTGYSQHPHMGEAVGPFDTAPWAQSGPSSAFSGSPALTDHSFQEGGVVAPQPLHPSHLQMDEWAQMEASQMQEHAQPSPMEMEDAVQAVYDEMVSTLDVEQSQVQTQTHQNMSQLELELQMCSQASGDTFDALFHAGAEGYGAVDSAMAAGAAEAYAFEGMRAY